MDGEAFGGGMLLECISHKRSKTLGPPRRSPSFLPNDNHMRDQLLLSTDYHQLNDDLLHLVVVLRD